MLAPVPCHGASAVTRSACRIQSGSTSDDPAAVDRSSSGYGFSGKPTVTGWGVEHMARAWPTLMNRLGYSQFVAQGGDWGAFVVDHMGVQAAEGLLAIHNSMPGTVPDDIDKALQAGDPPPDGLSAEELSSYEDLAQTFRQVDRSRFMASRAQTLYGISDSPVAVSVFPGEQYQAPQSWTEAAYPNLIYYNNVDKGGHFAAWEQPQLFSE